MEWITPGLTLIQQNLHVLHLHLHIPVLLEQSYFFWGWGRCFGGTVGSSDGWYIARQSCRECTFDIFQYLSFTMVNTYTLEGIK